jgi:hypothetical protein
MREDPFHLLTEGYLTVWIRRKMEKEEPKELAGQQVRERRSWKKRDEQTTKSLPKVVENCEV